MTKKNVRKKYRDTAKAMGLVCAGFILLGILAAVLVYFG